MVDLSFGRRPVIITDRSVIWTLALWTLVYYPHQEARNSPNTAQDQPKTARTLPKRRQQGPKRAPKRAQKESKKGPRRPGGAPGWPKRQHLRVGLQPRPSSIKNRAGSGVFWGPFWGPSWAPNLPKWTPERAQKRRPNLNDEKYPRRARKSAVRSVRDTPEEAKICVYFLTFQLFGENGPKRRSRGPQERILEAKKGPRRGRNGAKIRPGSVFRTI